MGMKEYPVAEHVSSFLPDDQEWELTWADEFDGTELDRTKWNFRLNYWGKPNPAYTDQGVRLDGDSHIELHIVEQDGYYVSPYLQTGSNSFDIPRGEAANPWNEVSFWPLGDLPKPQFMQRYGYFECRCKFQKHPERMWSAFWTQSPSIGTSYDPAWSGVESDIMEYFKVGEATTGNIMGGYGRQFREEGRVRYPLPESADGYHTFAMDWRPDSYVFYCDGQVVSRADKDVSQVPQFVLLSTEVQGYRAGKPARVEGKFEDDAFIADYVRVWQKKG